MSDGSTAESLSHNLRTSLNAVIGFTGTLLMQLPGPINAEQENQLQIIKNSARELQLQIDSLFEAAGIDSDTVIPQNPPPALENGAEPQGQKKVRRARILFIDDDPNSRKLMEYFLKAFGHEVLIAEGGQQGLEMARQQVPDLILCDLQMPHCSGHAVARELRGDPILCRIPLVAVTGISLIDRPDNSPAKLFDYSIRKPIHPDRLAGQLEFFLTRGAVSKESPRVIPGDPIGLRHNLL